MSIIRSLLLISRCPPHPLHLGDRLIIGNLVPELKARGVETDLIALCPPDPNQSIEAAYERDQALLPQYRSQYRRVTLLREPRRSGLSYVWRLLNEKSRFPQSPAQAWSPALFEQVQQHLASQRYDAIWLFGGVQVYEVAAALDRRPAVITPYESYARFLTTVLEKRFTPAAWLRQRMAAAYESFMFTPYQRVVVLAAPDAAMLKQLAPSLRLEVIPNGVRLPKLDPDARRPDVLLFVGNFEYAPNVEAAEYLIKEMLPIIHERHPNVELWLVGNAPPPELRQYTGSHIRITGYVDDMTMYMEQAAVFVAPLTVGAGLKNKVLEALAHRLPVVGTPLSVEGIHVTHEQSALVGEIEELPALVLRALDDDALRARMGQAGRELVERDYSWASVADRYLALFAELRPSDG
ncbi:MAG: glycosyltransferase family 4 protein [Anaerolineae bacterium]